MTDVSDAKAFAREWIDDNREWLGEFEQEIWDYHEPAWREYRSAEAYVELLREQGFAVEAGTGGMPTAFLATYEHGDGDGPTLASYAEYDAVPGNSQQRTPYRAPREGVHPYAAGHTDPHSVLGVGTLGGILAAKATMEEFDIDGRLKYFGEPAEKVCGSKPVHAAKGYFDDHDANIAFHPYSTNTVEWETYCGSYWSVVFTFEADAPETWASPGIVPSDSTHAQPRCPGALDAVSLMYTNVKHMKESMFPHTGSWTMNEYVFYGGQKTSDNLTPRISQIQYCWRSPTLDIQRRMYDILRRNAEAVAQATACTVSERWVTKTRVGLPNTELAALTYANLEETGAPSLSESAREFGREIQANLDREPLEEPFEPAAQRLTDPEEYEADKRSLLPDWQRNFTSDDYVDYSWHAPTVRLYTGRPRLRSTDEDYSYPEWTYNALGGVPEVTHPGMFTACETIATTLLDLLTTPETLARAQSEFEERTGGGIGGDEWVGPLLDEEFVPPTDLPWPEYVERNGEREWHLPTPRADTPLAGRYHDGP
ncbi:MAG: hypothetical protein SVG88_01525 [Halobacteriales archaeon]|nr:hypothetical protein [Halobacteriales archaeon]